MRVCDHGPMPHVASERRRQRQVQEFEGFCVDKGAQAQCCQYDCARHEECHGALAMIHGGVLRCLVMKNILVQLLIRRLKACMESKSSIHGG